MDDFATLKMAQIDPPSLWKDKDRIIIDEAQKLPAIFTAIKLTVDSDKSKRFIISGSSNLLLMEKITESLAGRALYFDLLPMTYGEIGGILSLSNFLSLWEGDKINTSAIYRYDRSPPFPDAGFYATHTNT